MMLFRRHTPYTSRTSNNIIKEYNRNMSELQ